MSFRLSSSRAFSLSLLAVSALGGLACSSGLAPSEGDDGAGGASPAVGGGASGGAASGGSLGVGGGVGGGVGAGGSLGPSPSGGAPSAGGSGGGSSGGADSGDGGAPTTGGGGNSPSSWGEVENPSADCEVGPLPSFGSLPASAKLPDPFKKMDGMRISSKSEWRCRREEIRRQALEFIYGEKPVTPESAVSGDVSSNMITVQVNDGGKMTSFNVTVNMNGATAPAPAIIGYGGVGGMKVPMGVAILNFTPVEATGGSGAKNGPFFTAYGANHEAGYLTAQAWQISRLLDLLEANPDVIDPKHVAVTGCSRYGKGAFVAGVLDNRIALTIPVESGLGGTVGLRLVETLDSYSGSEWPYHAISYVRWLSESALGQFTSGNNAGADNTDKLPVDMHEMMGLIAPRGLYIVDNPSTMYNGLDRNSAWVTAKVGQMIFEALGVGDHMAYEGASGAHCSWRDQYTPSLNAMIDKFLLDKSDAATGTFKTDLPNPPNHTTHIDWEPPTLAGEL